MFIGKSVCAASAITIAVVCGICASDRNVSFKNRVALAALASGLAAIVYSL